MTDEHERPDWCVTRGGGKRARQRQGMRRGLCYKCMLRGSEEHWALAQYGARPISKSGETCRAEPLDADRESGPGARAAETRHDTSCIRRASWVRCPLRSIRVRPPAPLDRETRGRRATLRVRGCDRQSVRNAMLQPASTSQTLRRRHGSGRTRSGYDVRTARPPRDLAPRRTWTRSHP